MNNSNQSNMYQPPSGLPLATGLMASGLVASGGSAPSSQSSSGGASLLSSQTSSMGGSSQESLGSSSGAGAPPVVVLNKQRLQELIQEIDPCEQLDEDAEEMLLQMADDFIESLVSSSCQVAKHRGSKSLEVRDVQLVLEKNWNMSIPGFGNNLSVLNRLKSHSATTEAHKQRMALIKKTLKKF